MTNTQAVIFVAVLFVFVAFFEEIETWVKRRWQARQYRKSIEHEAAKRRAIANLPRKP